MTLQLVHWTPTICNLAAAIASSFAAISWFRSAMIPAPGELRGVAGYGGPVTIDTKPLSEFVQRSGQLNKIAAGWSGAAALFVTLAIIGGLVAS